ncbi:hypothetical protein [Blastococcus brunescens]|uniref:Major facilitator superfamily (MFS) profile domain-containing protein n=1 Tax=Blastococcus brunescens TaxID=1564165 RepID=A0ABZ1B0U1_9ACTN|nr:hypothetical protein [Blastococcus sp. BMG 8361]WRL63361.1 hypothetical protein U6N30_27030 [Blastococcus sp. BMG 8361]
MLTALNLRTAVTSVGPVLEEIERGLGISSSLAGVITTMPVLCFALIGFTGPALSARYRDSHVLAGALLAMTVGLGVRSSADAFPVFLAGTALAMAGGALGNVMLPGLVKRHFPGRTGPSSAPTAPRWAWARPWPPLPRSRSPTRPAARGGAGGSSSGRRRRWSRPACG